MQDRVDSKACLITFCKNIPYLLLFAVTGAILGSGLYLLLAIFQMRTPVYMAETEYYVNFADGTLEAANYYNDFTWNDLMGTDPILGRTMEKLGSGYDKAAIKSMITADILSDVRYLTITVRGTDADLVGNVSTLTKEALEAYGNQIKDFESIYQIEDNGVVKEQKKLFAWRAAVLGSILFSLFFIVNFLIRFHLQEAFFTKADVMKCLGVPALGILLKNQQTSQEVESNVSYLAQKRGVKAEEIIYISLNDMEKPDYKRWRASGGLVLQVPWGVNCSKKAEYMMENLNIQDCVVLGITLVDADAGWLAWYGLGKR